jgi:hypothetical protein
MTNQPPKKPTTIDEVLAVIMDLKGHIDQAFERMASSMTQVIDNCSLQQETINSLIKDRNMLVEVSDGLLKKATVLSGLVDSHQATIQTLQNCLAAHGLLRVLPPTGDGLAN